MNPGFWLEPDADTVDVVVVVGADFVGTGLLAPEGEDATVVVGFAARLSAASAAAPAAADCFILLPPVAFPPVVEGAVQM